MDPFQVRREVENLDPVRLGFPAEAVVVSLRVRKSREWPDLRSSARRPALEPVLPGSTETVWFRDETEFLACLLADVASRRIDSWWWKVVLGGWPTPGRIEGLLEQVPARARVVLGRLEASGLIEPLRSWLGEVVWDRVTRSAGPRGSAPANSSLPSSTVPPGPFAGRREPGPLRSVEAGPRSRRSGKILVEADQDSGVSRIAPGHRERSAVVDAPGRSTDAGPAGEVGDGRLASREAVHRADRDPIADPLPPSRPRVSGSPASADAPEPESATPRELPDPVSGRNDANASREVELFPPESGPWRRDPGVASESEEAVPGARPVSGATARASRRGILSSPEPLLFRSGFGGILFSLNAFVALGWLPDFTRPSDPGIGVGAATLLRGFGERWFGRRFLADPLAEWLDAAGADPCAVPELDRLAPALEERLGSAFAERPSRAVFRLARRPAFLIDDGIRLVARFSLDVHPLRIRICGLDRDPGWTGGLGRDVRFEFQAGFRP